MVLRRGCRFRVELQLSLKCDNSPSVSQLGLLWINGKKLHRILVKKPLQTYFAGIAWAQAQKEDRKEESSEAS
jgi:hypothetical protein